MQGQQRGLRSKFPFTHNLHGDEAKQCFLHDWMNGVGLTFFGQDVDDHIQAHLKAEILIPISPPFTRTKDCKAIAASCFQCAQNKLLYSVQINYNIQLRHLSSYLFLVRSVPGYSRPKKKTNPRKPTEKPQEIQVEPYLFFPTQRNFPFI